MPSEPIRAAIRTAILEFDWHFVDPNSFVDELSDSIADAVRLASTPVTVDEALELPGHLDVGGQGERGGPTD